MDKKQMISYVEQAAAGDAKAIETLYKYTYSGAYSLTNHLCANQNDVEDILQESYITAFSRLNTIRDKAAFPAWLKKIVVNTWRAFAKEKSNAYETTVSDVMDDYFDESRYSESALDAVEISETSREIYELVNELPENQRVCMILFYYEDMKVDEIADVLNIPVGSVKSRLYYGRQQLRRMMEIRGFDSFGMSNIRVSAPVADSALLAKVLAALTAGSKGTAVVAGSGMALRVSVAIASLLTVGGLIGGAAAMRHYGSRQTKPASPTTTATVSTSASRTTTSAATTTATTAETTATAAATTASTAPRIFAAFDYSLDGDGIIVTRYIGNETNVVIPESIDGRKVTAVGDGAFKRSSVLGSVVIPSTVKTIGSSAFKNCRNLRSVTLGSGVETIGGSAFLGCSALQSIYIPPSVRHVGGYAFAYCTELAEAEAAQGVEVIGYAAFKECVGLKKATLPESVSSIGDDSFDGAAEDFYIAAPEGSYAYEYAGFKGFHH